MVTLLGVDAGAVAEPRLHAGDQIAPAAAVDELIVVRPLVFQRIVQVKTGPLGIEKAGADLSARTQVSVGRLTIDPETLRQAIGSAHADAAVVWTAAAGCDCVLAEDVSAPGVAGAVFYLRDRVRALALLLGQRHNRRIVLTHIVAHAGAEAPSVGHLIGQVQFHRPRIKPLVLRPLIGLGHQGQAATYWHFEHAAVLLRVLDRHLSRRRVTGVESLRVELETTLMSLNEVTEPDAHVGAVGPSF